MVKEVDIYLSFILVVRDDDYGGNLRKRINNWINYTFRKLKTFNSEIELIIVNWNPPEGSFIHDWIELKNVENFKICTISNETHNSYIFNQDRPVLDYIARNKGVNEASGNFICIINQDIYLSDKVFEIIQNKIFDSRHFYRIDRCDIPSFNSFFQKVIENGECSNSKTVHRRHKDNNPISINLEKYGDTPVCSIYDSSNFEISISHSDFIKTISQIRIENLPNLDVILNTTGLHTNASGDFIIVSKENFSRSGGFIETALFYMHLDTYFILQLWVMGLQQVLLPHPYHAFHIEHERYERLNRAEYLTWSQHEIIMLNLIYGTIPYKLN